MEYEYKALVLYSLGRDEENALNKAFSEGWEYVHGVSQTVATSGNGYTSKEGNLLITLRRKKESVQL